MNANQRRWDLNLRASAFICGFSLSAFVTASYEGGNTVVVLGNKRWGLYPWC